MASEPPTPEELTVQAAELEVRRLEAAKAMATISSPWWRRADPLVLAILAGVLTLLGNMAVALLNNYNSLEQEQKKADSSLIQEQKKNADDLALEQAKAKYNLVLQAMATNDAAVAKRNIHFFIDAGLLPDADCRIRNAIDQDQPVLPSLSGVAPARLGYAFADRWLVFVRGGGAWTNEKVDDAYTNFVGIPVDPSASRTRTGWTAGTGVDWAFATQWSATFEYNYYDFGKDGIVLTGSAPLTRATVFSLKDTIHAVTAGVNYHF